MINAMERTDRPTHVLATIVGLSLGFLNLGRGNERIPFCRS